VKKETWPEALPGCEDALRFARDPIEFARAKIATAKPANLARNGDFGSDKTTVGDGAEVKWKENGAPAGWEHMAGEGLARCVHVDRETGAAGKGSARTANVADGCFIQSCAAKPGERYAVAAVRKSRATVVRASASAGRRRKASGPRGTGQNFRRGWPTRRVARKFFGVRDRAGDGGQTRHSPWRLAASNRLTTWRGSTTFKILKLSEG